MYKDLAFRKFPILVLLAKKSICMFHAEGLFDLLKGRLNGPVIDRHPIWAGFGMEWARFGL